MAKRNQNETENDDITEYFRKELGSEAKEKIESFISTGSTLLDYSIANRKNGGVPVGRVIELIGDPASGKSLLAYHIMANTQKKGGVAFYIDTERSLNQDFMERMGVNTKKLIMPKPTPSSIEEVFDYIEKIITATRLKFPKKDKPVTIVWDSIAATQAKEEIENAHADSARLGAEARAMSRGMKKLMTALDDGFVTLVCINQLREKIGVSFGDTDTTPHGKALSFYASVRIKLKSMQKIKDPKDGRILGVSTQAKVIKNKCGPSWRSCDFPLYFDWGVDDDLSFLEYMKDLEYIESGVWSKLKTDKEEFKFQGTEGWLDLMKKPEVRNFVLDKVEESMVIKFDRKPESVMIDTDSILEVEQVKNDLDNLSSGN